MNTLEEKKNNENQLQRNQCNTDINSIIYYCMYENTSGNNHRYESWIWELPGDEVNTTDALSTDSVLLRIGNFGLMINLF